MIQNAPVPTGGKAAVVAPTTSDAIASRSSQSSCISLARFARCNGRGALLSGPVGFPLLGECERAFYRILGAEKFRLQVVVLRQRFLHRQAEAVQCGFLGSLHRKWRAFHYFRRPFLGGW